MGPLDQLFISRKQIDDELNGINDRMTYLIKTFKHLKGHEEVNLKLRPPGYGKILPPFTLDKSKAILVDKLTLVSYKPRTGIGETSECNQGKHTLIHTHRILLEEGPKPPNIHK